MTAGVGSTIACDEVVDVTLGTVKVGFVKVMDGTLDGTAKLVITSAGAKVDLGADNDVIITSGTLTAVTAITNALPAGANAIGKLAANNAVNIGSVDVLTMPTVTVGSHAVTNAGTFAVQNTAALPAGTNNIGDVDVLSLPALPAGSNNIGDVDVLTLPAVTNAGTFAVQATSVIPGTAATNLGKAEDAVHTSGDVGVMTLGVRNDAGTTLAADGDYIPFSIDAAGALRVTGGGGGTQYTEDAVAAADPVGSAMILVRKDTPSATVSADGDNVAARGTNYGAAYVTLLDTAGAPVSVGGGTQYMEDAAAAADPIGTAMIMVRKDTLAALTSTDGDNVAARGTDKGELYVKHVDAIPASQSGTWNITNVSGTVSLPTGAATEATLTSLNGKVTAVNTGAVTIAAALPAGANAIGKLGANSGVNIGTVDVGTVTGTVTVASHAVTNAGTFATQVTSLPAVPAGSNLIGNVGHGQVPKVKTGSASATFTIVPAVASNKIKVYSLSLMTASTSAVTVTFKDGAAGTVLATYILQAITGTNFGITENLSIPSSLFETSTNTLLEMSFSAAVAVTYNLRYFEQA